MNAVLEPAAPFTRWDATAYLDDYYGRLERDEELSLRFLVHEFGRLGPRGRVLEFGCGPTVHHLLPLAPHVGVLDVADFLPANLDQVRRWLRREPGAHDWRAFTRHVLACEGTPRAGADAIEARESLTRRRVRQLLHCDAALARPLPTWEGAGYDALVSCFCVDSATDDRATWRRYMAHMLGLLRPGGAFIGAALRRCRRYRVGDTHYPGADVDERDIEQALRSAGFDRDSLHIQVEPVPQHRARGYEAIVMVSGVLAA